VTDYNESRTTLHVAALFGDMHQCQIAVISIFTFEKEIDQTLRKTTNGIGLSTKNTVEVT
jgi:hypothetical protein